jgi:hypothetical protein
VEDPQRSETLTLFYLALWKAMDLCSPRHSWFEITSESADEVREEIVSFLKSDVASWGRDSQRVVEDGHTTLRL